jgi:threonine/homoserine/homoserine lactone efflux protein
VNFFMLDPEPARRATMTGAISRDGVPEMDGFLSQVVVRRLEWPLQERNKMFGIADYAAFVAAVIVFLAIPGPGNLALVTSTGKGGLPGGFAAAAGVIAGDQVLMWLAVAGVSAVLKASPGLFAAVQWLGAGYLAWIGLRMVLAKPGDAPIIQIRPRHYFRQALAITLLNPKAIVFYMAFFPLFVDPAQHRGLVTFGFMAATIAMLTFLYAAAVVLLTWRLADRLRSSPRTVKLLNRVAGSLLVGFGVKLALTR